jgi:hypothetical protein
MSSPAVSAPTGTLTIALSATPTNSLVASLSVDKKYTESIPAFLDAEFARILPSPAEVSAEIKAGMQGDEAVGSIIFTIPQEIQDVTGFPASITIPLFDENLGIFAGAVLDRIIGSGYGETLAATASYVPIAGVTPPPVASEPVAPADSTDAQPDLGALENDPTSGTAQF